MNLNSELRGKKVVVVGLGRSGVSSARLLAQGGAKVLVTDRQPEQDLRKQVEMLKDYPIRYGFGGHKAHDFKGASFVVLSPGVPRSVIAGFQIPIIGEIELACRHLKSPLIGITGTNGKSTTASLVGEMIKKSGKRVFVGGNLGLPLCEAVLMKESPEWVVAELSSFQLESIELFHPKIAAILNVAPDHLDRYPGFSDYLKAKQRIFLNQGPDDWGVINRDDPSFKGLRAVMGSREVGFSRKTRLPKGVWSEDDWLVSNIKGDQKILPKNEIRLSGEHNLENAMAAVAIAQLAGCSIEGIRKALNEFQGLEHRFERVREFNAVSYINDSKATTVSAVIGALKGIKESVVLIAGGRNKGMDFTLLNPVVGQKVRAVVLLGESRQVIREALESIVPVYDAFSMKEAVEISASLAQALDTVLLSPGCSSYDMFQDFEDRGRQFKEVVAQLG